MEETSEKTPANNTQSNGKFLRSLIGQWMNRAENNMLLNQTEEMAESSDTHESRRRYLQNQDRIIQSLKHKLKESEKAQASLSASLEVDARNKEEVQTKLNGTWESIETITEYFNYISESLTSFQQHRVNLSTQYDNVILKQQEAIRRLELDNAKSKDLENHVAHLQNTSSLQEERLREAQKEQNKLQKQLEKTEYELQLQKNELTNKYAEEKMTFVKEQQQLLSEYENLQSRHQMAEKAKYDVTESAAQLENKLLLQEEKMQEVLTEQNKLREQMENTEREFYSQKNELAIAHAEEKRALVEEQRRLLSELTSLRSRTDTIEQDKNNITQTVAQKDEIILKLQKEISAYKNEIEVIMTNSNEMHTKCEALIENQNMWQNELHTKAEKIQNLEAMLNTIKRKETSLVNDINRLEKKLTNEMDYSKNLESKLSNTQKSLQLAQDQNAETQRTLKQTETNNELINIELQRQLNNLEMEREEIINRESMKVKNAEILYEKAQAEHIQEISALNNTYDMHLIELNNTIKYLNETNNDFRKERNTLNKSLMEMKAENSSLKDNYESIEKRNESLQDKLKEATEMLQMKRMEDTKVIRNESMKIDKKNAEMYEKAQAKHTQEISALKSTYETQLVELKNTIQYLNEMNNDVRKERNTLNKSLEETKVENSSLKDNYESIKKHNESLQDKLKKATEMMQVKRTEATNVRSESIKIDNKVSTSQDFHKKNDADNNEQAKWSLPPKRTYSISQQSQKEQEAEVTSAGKKFFKSARPKISYFQSGKRKW